MIKIENIEHFNTEHIFLCGQCFRWNETSYGEYLGVTFGHVAKVSIKDKNLLIESDYENKEFWINYFNLDNDYSRIKESLSHDDKLKECIDYGYGIRIIRQDVWETIVSFIISANNNIPRIKKIIEKLCVLYGGKIEYLGNEYHSFPNPETLAKLDLKDLGEIKAGFRDKYILDAAKKVANGEINISEIEKMDDEDARRELMKIKGIGNKVADCILLFSLGRYKTFPKDVWIKRILNDVYKVDEKETEIFVKDKFGKFAGFAQQYLFYYYRERDKIK